MADRRRILSEHSAEQLAALARITPEDIASAQRAFRQDASPAFRDLLDARPDTKPPTTS